MIRYIESSVAFPLVQNAIYRCLCSKCVTSLQLQPLSSGYGRIERQLTCTKRVEDVLGNGWKLYAEGEKLQVERAAFRRMLDARPVYGVWVHDIIHHDMGVTGRLPASCQLGFADHCAAQGRAQLGSGLSSQVLHAIAGHG
jgi:hypothetical protein